MINKFLEKFFGNKSEKFIKNIKPIVEKINIFYEDYNEASEDKLKNRIKEIKEDIKEKLSPMENEQESLEKKYQTTSLEKEKNELLDEINKQKTKIKDFLQEILDAYLPEVFAIVKQTCKRLKEQKYTYNIFEETYVWDMVPFDVQLMGGIVLHKGMISEMATGEGKTLVAILPLFLNALSSKSCHLITVNDYLAQRDSKWMAPVFEFFDLSVGCITMGMSPEVRKKEYEKDVLYGTNSEFGFDYLRDNMVTRKEHLVQRDLSYAIIDEVDSVLVDEARTPLIISGPVAKTKNFFDELKPVINRLVSLQKKQVAEILREVREAIAKEELTFELGEKLLLIQKADPKNIAFSKIIKDPQLKQLLQNVENEYIRDKKMHKIDAELFYVVDEKANSVDLGEKGQGILSQKDETLFVMNSLDELILAVEQDENLSLAEKEKEKRKISEEFMDKSEKLHNIEQLLRAYSLFIKDKDYVVMEEKVLIVDEFTGRLMPGRRFSDGLHQALEAKENVKIEESTQTFASITIQNYFKMYDKISGMTGTAVTEEEEFIEIYNLPVIEVPTNLPISRIDFDDMIYMTKNEKYKAIIEEIDYWHKKEKPVLVGTVSVDVSEILSKLLKRKGIKHEILNAKQHKKEAEIVKNAGEKGAVTIATNMAGRGTDIKLKSGVVEKEKEFYLESNKKINEEFPYGLILDGLHVIGTERHESRRIDRQLRGRAGRQGDPGTSRFYLSLEDDLMRLFGSDRIAPMMKKLGFEKDEAITHSWMNKAVERAQKRVEAHNFQIRKQLMEFDKVMNHQRQIIYSYRKGVLKGYDLLNEVVQFIKDTLYNFLDSFEKQEFEDENIFVPRLLSWLNNNFNIIMSEKDILNESGYFEEEIFVEKIIQKYFDREKELGKELLRDIERQVVLQTVDELWIEHLHEMDFLKDGIGLKAYGQKDPLIEYKKESYVLFEKLLMNISETISKRLFIFQTISQKEIDLLENAQVKHSQASAFSGKEEEEKPIIAQRKVENKVGRNDPCPCGSGLKYKKCCGKDK